MIKTLRITIIVTAILAVVFFVLSAAFGLRHDGDKETFLAKPTATQVFKKTSAGRGTGEVEAPLIKQAQAFALRINPPKPVERGPVEISKPVVEAPKFRLLGTSFYPLDPDKSMALIDEPGKGMHWVAADDNIERLTVIRIEDGKLVYTDGKKELEMLAEKPVQVGGISVIGSSGEQTYPPQAPASPSVQEETPVQPTAEEIKENAEFIKKLIAEANDAKKGGQGGETGMSEEEANDLQGLGEMLKQLEDEQKKAEEAQKQGEDAQKPAEQAEPDANAAPAESNMMPAEPTAAPAEPNAVQE